MLTHRTLVTAVLLLLVCGSAGAQHAEPPRVAGKILFLRKGALFESLADGSSKPTKLADVPKSKRATSLLVSYNGRTMLINNRKSASWIIGGEIRHGKCTGAGVVSRTGSRVVCPRGKRYSVRRVRSGKSAQLPAGLRDVSFLPGKKGELVALSDDGVVAFTASKPKKQRLLAKPKKRQHMIVAPSGKRAIAIVGEGELSRIFTFALDGVGVMRQLGGPGLPVRWSRDSVWVLLQVGEPPEGDEHDPEGSLEMPRGPGGFAMPDDRAPRRKRKRSRKRARKRTRKTSACATRAVGGQSKCWTGYQAVTFSPDATRVLLYKNHGLYVGKMSGPRAERPKKILDNVDGPADWID